MKFIMVNLAPIFTLTGLGIAFGIGLAIAAKKLCLAVDPRLETVFSSLPGANCGACGMPGCMGFAEGLIEGNCSIESCVAAADDTKELIASLLGKEVKKKIKTVAVLHCQGGNKRVKDKFVYAGLEDCVSANLIMRGPKECVYGCIGFGTCMRACPFGAISINEDGLPVIDENKCTACGRCVTVCPKKLFSLAPVNKIYNVRCKSEDLGKRVMQVCSVGCIACRKCEKSCPRGAIKLINNLAVIDYNLCENNGACFKECPTKTIAKKEGRLWKSRD